MSQAMTHVDVWPGWLAGIAIGGYLLLQYWLTGKALGCSTAYGNACGFISRTPFFSRGEYESLNNWRLWFVLGLPLGGLVAALTSQDANLVGSLSMGVYDAVLPAALWARAGYLFLGGILIGFGARLAGGCQSGHSINGLSQLNGPSLLASVGFFVGGIATTQALFGFAGGGL